MSYTLQRYSVGNGYCLPKLIAPNALSNTTFYEVCSFYSIYIALIFFFYFSFPVISHV